MIAVSIILITFIICPILFNIQIDKLKDDKGISGGWIILFVVMTFLFTFHLDLIFNIEGKDGMRTFLFWMAPLLYVLYVAVIFRYLIYVVLRFLIKPFILLDSSMTAKIEQNKNAIKNSQNNQNNP